MNFKMMIGLLLPLAAEGEAIDKGDPRIRGWASVVHAYVPGEELEEGWRETGEALGPAEGGAFTVVSLGRGGSLTLGFPRPIVDGPGIDFAVFENAFSASFLELAFVEVSENGVDFVRFTSDSRTPAPVGPFGGVNPENVDGLAGKYPAGQGTGFDLSGTGLSSVRFVRLVDVVGGQDVDSSGDLIFDPYPTVGSAGFDLDGVGVLHFQTREPELHLRRLATGDLTLQWRLELGERRLLMGSNGLLDSWEPLLTLTGTGQVETTALGSPGLKMFYRLQ